MTLLPTLDALSCDSGAYVLWIYLSSPRELKITSLGGATFPPGWYTYTGRASRALRARLQRHVRREKKRRWHVDYFLTETAFVSQIWVYDRHPEWECEINHLLESESNSFVPLPGFGASDCTHGCRAHLLGHPKQLKAVSFPLQPDWIVHLKDVTVDVISGLWENPVLL